MSGRFLSKRLVRNMGLQQKFKYIIWFIPTYHFLAEAEAYYLISLVEVYIYIHMYILSCTFEIHFPYHVLLFDQTSSVFGCRRRRQSPSRCELNCSWSNNVKSPQQMTAQRVRRAETCFTSGGFKECPVKGNWEPTVVMPAQQESSSNPYSEGLLGVSILCQISCCRIYNW